MSDIALPAGFRAAGMWAGIKKPGRGSDLALLVADEPVPTAAMFTRNALVGAHVTVCREQLAKSKGLIRAVIVNAGCANCATGQRGIDDARETARLVAERLGCRTEQVLPISTGAIGAHLPMDKIRGGIPALVDALDAQGADAFARGIMTTDTVRKLHSATFATPSGEARVTGAAKGAGMIHPNMATMLGFLATDAVLPRAADELLRDVVDRSFHRVTVDGDTSPNDTVVLMASGRFRSPDEELCEGALIDVGTRLARAIARDGEGATRLVTVEVRGAASDTEALRCARTIATSPLVKTAIAGRDPNWGRILSAAGRSDVAIDVARARVWVGEQFVYEDGKPHPEREPAASKHLQNDEEVVIGVDLAIGDAGLDVWTCDFTADYVRINADYRT
ncbi:MAG: bifunctional glutamate N-acetyltransferase/amino-acid acetyltransferase ArgJ [Planctomycetota bacterium]